MILLLGMTKPEQELLAKYLLQQLISKDPDPSLDPVVARLTHDEVRRLTRDHLSESGRDSKREFHEWNCYY